MTAHNQFVNLHGQRGARLERNQSVHGLTINPRTTLVKFLSPFLFGAPEIHLRALDKIWVDNLVHRGHWNEFISKLNTEWQEFSLIVQLFRFRVSTATISLVNCRLLFFSPRTCLSWLFRTLVMAAKRFSLQPRLPAISLSPPVLEVSS